MTLCESFTKTRRLFFVEASGGGWRQLGKQEVEKVVKQSLLDAVEAPAQPSSGGDLPMPGEKDVICGKGGHAANHGGNQDYLAVVKLECTRYRGASSCKEKKKIAARVFEFFRRRNTRFVQKDETLAGWREAGEEKCLDKIKHALRDAPAGVVGPAAICRNRGADNATEAAEDEQYKETDYLIGKGTA
jgi:hypothetical protein